MHGPVGLRCKTCGTPSRDPLTAMTPRQMGLGALVALGAGTVGGFICNQAGFFFVIILGPIAGGVIAEAVMRVTGYKRGPKMYAIVGGGIIGGALIGAAFYYYSIVGSFGVPSEELGPGFFNLILTGALVYVIAALVGADSRIR